jgi:hypothetical protein
MDNFALKDGLYRGVTVVTGIEKTEQDHPPPVFEWFKQQITQSAKKNKRGNSAKNFAGNVEKQIMPAFFAGMISCITHRLINGKPTRARVRACP